MLSQAEMKRFNDRIAAVEKRLHSGRKIAVGYVEVLTALMQVLGEENPESICRMDLPEEELFRRLESHPFEAPAILGEIDAPSIEVPGSIRRIYAALAKVDTTLWEILGGGPDPFPSNPWAHNEIEDIDMDLSDGKLYHDRAYVHQLRRRELTAFRDRIREAYPELALPPMADPC